MASYRLGSLVSDNVLKCDRVPQFLVAGLFSTKLYCVLRYIILHLYITTNISLLRAN